MPITTMGRSRATGNTVHVQTELIDGTNGPTAVVSIFTANNMLRTEMTADQVDSLIAELVEIGSEVKMAETRAVLREQVREGKTIGEALDDAWSNRL